MTWGPFSAEAVRLDSMLRKAHKEGRTSAAIEMIEYALKTAHLRGPSNMSAEDFEAGLLPMSTDANDPAAYENTSQPMTENDIMRQRLLARRAA